MRLLVESPKTGKRRLSGRVTAVSFFIVRNALCAFITDVKKLHFPWNRYAMAVRPSTHILMKMNKFLLPHFLPMAFHPSVVGRFF